MSFRIALAAVVIYNLVGLVDIVSTAAGIGAGTAEEANPLIRAAMDSLGPGWIAAKLFLQGVVSVMVLWFPHKIVTGFFLCAVLLNGFVVLNNIRIVYGV